MGPRAHVSREETMTGTDEYVHDDHHSALYRLTTINPTTDENTRPIPNRTVAARIE